MSFAGLKKQFNKANQVRRLYGSELCVSVGDFTLDN